jgi:hypothetical protein
MRFANAVVMVALCSVAHAGPTAPVLQTQGEELAKQGRFTEAIDACKQADRIEPTTAHACLIGLAYIRRELWPQAEIWLAQCQARGSATDPLPDWLPTAQTQIAERLAAANVAAVELVVEPAAADARLTVSAFARDEQFAPRTIHLPPGLHEIVASAPGYLDAHEHLDLVDRSPRRVVLHLEKRPMPATPETKLLIAGAATFGAGLGTWAWMGYERSKLDEAEHAIPKDKQLYNAHSTRFDVARVATIGLWTVGVGLAIAGYVMGRHDERPAIAVAPVRGGAMLSVEWTK